MPEPIERFGFAGDRKVAVEVLAYLLDQGIRPEFLLIAAGSTSTHADQLRSMCPWLDDNRVAVGTEFRSAEGVQALAESELDLVVAVHFPYMIPRKALDATRLGWLNLHPALLPFNRGWHTPTWAILDGTPAGATLHFMDEGLDTGDVVSQREVVINPADTADSLYQRIMWTEVQLFRDTWPSIAEGSYERRPQAAGAGTFHRREDLIDSGLQHLDLTSSESTGQLLRRLRGLTTNRVDEAAFFLADGKRYRIRVIITEDGAAD